MLEKTLVYLKHYHFEIDKMFDKFQYSACCIPRLYNLGKNRLISIYALSKTDWSILFLLFYCCKFLSTGFCWRIWYNIIHDCNSRVGLYLSIVGCLVLQKNLGGSPGLVVMGDHSWSRARGFESWHHILDVMTFSH